MGRTRPKALREGQKPALKDLFPIFYVGHRNIRKKFNIPNVKNSAVLGIQLSGS